MFVAFLGQDCSKRISALVVWMLLLSLSFLLQDSYIAPGNYTFIYQELSYYSSNSSNSENNSRAEVVVLACMRDAR